MESYSKDMFTLQYAKSERPEYMVVTSVQFFDNATIIRFDWNTGYCERQFNNDMSLPEKYRCGSLMGIYIFENGKIIDYTGNVSRKNYEKVVYRMLKRTLGINERKNDKNS